ncbi:release factor glutamine methyltransferase [Bacteroidia bacterium]|nr:release factor glutamine methyltransferase [Bacteroidia bacterium]GHU81552.1 release factor glutamine methyltransferase [Bacteroidia bacterium]GHV70651.1 release factor glutamine methyltransferase [Bacteroidia bacterium]
MSYLKNNGKMQTTLNLIKAQLQHLYSDAEIKAFGFLILESVCCLDKQAVLRDKDKQLSPNERFQIGEIIESLKKYRPIQYILGETEFYGLRFKVNENVLIPRPETEELVDLIQSDYRKSPLSVLDIGTGSGCIAIALAKNLPDASVYALDISEKALEIARQNAERNRVNVHFFQQDILADFPANSSGDLPEKWDIIVSNPPYVTPEEKRAMSKNVLDYEPHQALFAPQKKPLLFYERIADMGLNRLEESGALYFETSALYGKETVGMLREKGYRSVQLLQDISGKDRMIIARL